MFLTLLFRGVLSVIPIKCGKMLLCLLEQKFTSTKIKSVS